MSVNAVMTVSIAPDSISERSSSMVSAGRTVMRLSSSSVLVVLASSPPLADEASQQRRGRVAVLLHERPSTITVAGKHSRNDRVVLNVRMADVALKHRDRRQHLLHGRLCT